MSGSTAQTPTGAPAEPTTPEPGKTPDPAPAVNSGFTPPANQEELDKIIAKRLERHEKDLREENTRLKTQLLAGKPTTPPDPTPAGTGEKGDQQQPNPVPAKDGKPEPGKTTDPAVLSGEDLATARLDAVLEHQLTRDDLVLLTATSTDGIKAQAAQIAKLRGPGTGPRMVVPGAGAEPKPPSVRDLVAQATQAGDFKRSTAIKAAQLQQMRPDEPTS